MSASKFPNWMNEFIVTAFGDFTNQKDFVNQQKEQMNIQNQNSINQYNKDVSENGANTKGINDQTGETFEIVVKDKSSKNKDRKDLGLQIEFSSGKNKEKYICSSIEDFCNGRFTNLKDEPIETIATEISKDNKFIFNFLETSVASLSDSIKLDTAVDIANKIIHNAKILEVDYKKLCSKLNGEDLRGFDNYLKNGGISITANNEKDKVNYYLNYIKNFKEYKLISEGKTNQEHIDKLRNRIASISLFTDLKDKLYDEFKKDEVLKNL